MEFRTPTQMSRAAQHAPRDPTSGMSIAQRLEGGSPTGIERRGRAGALRRLAQNYLKRGNPIAARAAVAHALHEGQPPVKG